MPTAQTRTPAAPVMLTIDDVARELNVSALQVRRLVARSALSGTELHPGDWRFAPKELERYIGAGALDLAMPAVTDRWFEDLGLRMEALEFQRAVQTATEDQRMPDAALRKAVEASRAESFNVKLTASPALDELFAQPYRHQRHRKLFRVPGQDNSPPFELWSDALFVDQLRTAVLRRVRDASRLQDNHLLKLYASPSAYRGFVDPSEEEVRNGSISFSEVRSLVGVNVELTVNYSLALSMYAKRLRELARLAF